MDSGLWSVHCCAITLQYTNHYLPANRKCYCFLANFVITVQKGLGGSELYLKRYKCVAHKMSPKICRPQWWTAARSSPLDPLLILGCTCVVSCPLVNCRVLWSAAVLTVDVHLFIACLLTITLSMLTCLLLVVMSINIFRCYVRMSTQRSAPCVEFNEHDDLARSCFCLSVSLYLYRNLSIVCSTFRGDRIILRIR